MSTARIYYPILIYIPIIGVCCMIFHNNIPCHFIIVEGVAQLSIVQLVNQILVGTYIFSIL
jgi:hypothetical protein